MKNALELLKQDHKHMKTLLNQLKETTIRATKTRPEILKKLELELLAHSKIEEEIFYPALQQAAQTNEQKELLAAAFEEHRAVEKLLLPDLKKSDISSEVFGGRAKVLREIMERHIDEEEAEMFPLVEVLLSKEELKELGGKMTDRKNEFIAKKRAA